MEPIRKIVVVYLIPKPINQGRRRRHYGNVYGVKFLRNVSKRLANLKESIISANRQFGFANKMNKNEMKSLTKRELFER